jgi:hypothetical protein
MSCPTTVNETVCVEALVTINPQVTIGEIQAFCVGDPVIGACPGMPVPFCSFQVSQNICVQVPLTFDAIAKAEPTGIVCGTPTVGGCDPDACTLTIGYFRNHSDVTNALITAAGGIIVLGSDNAGLSFTVTTANANNVLSLNTPSPPAPSSPPFSNQYQVLYAQLLAADLNMQNGATCDAAMEAIANANTFLATSPPGGKAGAPAVQQPLANFNEGTVFGCPGHCD